MKSIMVVSTFIMFVNIANASVLYTVDEASKKGLIKYAIKSKGGYIGKVMEVSVQNLTNQKLRLNMEEGRRLDSKNDQQQDILITKTQTLYLNEHEEKSILMYGMCCEAHKSSPSIGAVYGIGEMASDELIKLVRFIDENAYWQEYAAQQAVWSISDNNSIGSIQCKDTITENKLKRIVSAITGRPIPKYNVTYTQHDGYDLQGKVTKVEATFDYTVSANGHITIGIYDEHGTLVQLLFSEIPHKAGSCKLRYIFNTNNLPQGTYYVRMNNNDVLEKEEKISF